MAFTERYVTSAASGGGDGSSGNPWTLSEAFSNAAAGDRVNVQSDSSYSIGSTTLTNAGTTAQCIYYRGYNSTIGDLDSQGRNDDNQTLNTTNMPAVTITGNIIPKAYTVFQSFNFSGSISAALFGDFTQDNTVFIKCKFLNSQNNVNAVAVRGDDELTIIDCDIECSGSNHGFVIDSDNNIYLDSCRVKSNANDCVNAHYGIFIDNQIFGSSTDDGINVTFKTFRNVFRGNTFYNVDSAIKLPNQVSSKVHQIINNHVTDCTRYIDDQYSATANTWYLEMNNRTRDNTTPRTGVGDGVNLNEETTDTGGASTDYENAASENFRLISTAPGKAAGILKFTDCGALQREEPAGGSGGDMIDGLHAIGSGAV